MFIRVWNTYISCSTYTFYIIRKPIAYSNYVSHDISSIHHYFIFIGLQIQDFYTFQKIIKKKDNQKKIL